MKILIATDHYPPFIGGAHRQSQLLGQELHQRGHEVKVATVWHGGFPQVEEDNGVEVNRLKQLRTFGFWVSPDGKQRHQAPFPDPVTIIGLRKLINRFKPDIIHSYGWITYSCAVALTGKHIPLLVSARDYAYACPNQTLLMANGTVCSGPEFWKCMACAGAHYGLPKGWVTTVSVYAGRGLIKRKIDGMHSISTYVQQMLHRDFWRTPAAPEKDHRGKVIEAIIPSFREDEIAGQPKQVMDLSPWLSQLPDEAYILFVGALRRVKGVYQLLDAYSQLRSAPPLVLIGTLEYDSPKEVPAGVKVLQNFPHPAVMQAWERSLFGVIPSLWPEPLGSVVYEGMSQGKAMIGTAPGGHTDMILDGQTGLLVPAGDTAALTHAMQCLIDNPTLRGELGRAAFERAKLFTAGNAVPLFESLYRQVIQSD